MRLCSAQGRPFSRHAGRARGRRGWYILCPEVPKLLKALWPAVPARSALPPACGSVVLPTPWGPRASMTRPPPSHSRRTARFCSGLAPSHLHVTARHRAPHDTHPSRPPRWDFAHHAMTIGTRQAQSLHGRLPHACHLPVTVSRTESSLWVDWSGGFVPWHLSCESIAQLENAPASPEARVFFPAETQPFVLGGIKMNCASKFVATCRSHGLRQAAHSIKSRCGILSGSLEGFPRDQNERTSSDGPRDARGSGAYRGARPVPTDRAPARLPACLSRQGLSSTRPCPDLLREATGSARRHGGEQLTDPRQ